MTNEGESSYEIRPSLERTQSDSDAMIERGELDGPSESGESVGNERDDVLGEEGLGGMPRSAPVRVAALDAEHLRNAVASRLFGTAAEPVKIGRFTVLTYARAAEMVFTTDPVDAETAERIGLVNRVVPADRLMDEATDMARRLAKSAPLALALAKRGLNRALDASLEQALEYEAQLQSIAGRSADHAEGVAAFVEKREAKFKGE